jgi:hypothetical protein
VNDYVFDSTVKQSGHKFLAKPDSSFLNTDFYAVFSGLFGENEKLGGTVADL